MEKEKTLLELIEGLKDEFDFLPPDENIRKDFLTFIKFIILGS
ncbi:hypothetical protein [Clostridium formicaceticum]|uniref:Uncharacterized protein n=1 Tax=Clostridium formicaceticum TaxID=1497 RepID=A0AAC9RPF9_9CLOT|nr:hypothetical protein [Clostridium formicaceticum]ARE88923.1 hypothetical protein CLFO_33290 [Clostridium formicaceticum]